MPKLFLVRHGEPRLAGTLLGRLDPPLSERGLEQARAALSEMDAAIAYVSPLRRAQQTASFLPASIPRVTLPDLPEVSLGDWEGLTWAEVEQAWPDAAARKLANWFNVPAPGGETWDQVRERAQRVMDRVRAGPFPAVIVAHHGINAVLSHLVCGADPCGHAQTYCEVVHHDF